MTEVCQDGIEFQKKKINFFRAATVREQFLVGIRFLTSKVSNFLYVDASNFESHTLYSIRINKVLSNQAVSASVS